MRTKSTFFVIDNTVIIEFQEYCYSWNFLFDPFKMSLHDTAQKMKFSTKDFFSKCNQIRIVSFVIKLQALGLQFNEKRDSADLATFIEEILNGKLHFFV